MCRTWVVSVGQGFQIMGHFGRFGRLFLGLWLLQCDVRFFRVCASVYSLRRVAFFPVAMVSAVYRSGVVRGASIRHTANLYRALHRTVIFLAQLRVSQEVVIAGHCGQYPSRWDFTRCRPSVRYDLYRSAFTCRRFARRPVNLVRRSRVAFLVGGILRPEGGVVVRIFAEAGNQWVFNFFFRAPASRFADDRGNCDLDLPRPLMAAALFFLANLFVRRVRHANRFLGQRATRYFRTVSAVERRAPRRLRDEFVCVAEASGCDRGFNVARYAQSLLRRFLAQSIFLDPLIGVRFYEVRLPRGRL